MACLPCLFKSCNNKCGVFNPELVAVFKNIIADVVANTNSSDIPALAIG